MQKMLLLGCLCIHLCLMSSVVNAINFAGKHGAVMARTVLLGENGKPILVEYDETGDEKGGPIGYDGEFSKLSIIPASLYEQEQHRLKKFDELYENTLKTDAKVMSRETFLQGSYPTADGKSTMTFSEVGNKVKVTITRQEGGATTADFPLPSYVKSVYVRGRSYRIEPKPEQLVLLSFSVDLSKQASFEGKKTLLMGEKGEIIHSSIYNIAPRVGFFGDPTKKQEYGIRKNEDEIFGPVKNATVFIDPYMYPGSMTLTDEDGKYSMKFFLPYCPGGFEFKTDLWAQLFYRNFNPNGQILSHYYLRRQDWTYCFDPFPMYGPTLGAQMAYVNALAIKATSAVPFYNADFRVDVMFLTGRFLMRNPDGSVIEVTDKTEYKAEGFDESDPEKWITQNRYDFDNDGRPDSVELGIMKDELQEDGTTKQVFTEMTSAEIEQEAPGKALQAVYFSSNAERPRDPDLIRVADTRPQEKKSAVLLKTISEEDLRQTDIYVFRESTGDLVLERNGLTEQEATALPPEEIQLGLDTGVAKDEDYFYYRLMLRGRYDYDLNIGGGVRRDYSNPNPNVPQGWEKWAEIYQLSEPFRKREADHLRSGEWIRIVAINRKTGYVGTQRVQLSDASQNTENMLNVKLEDTYLEPPNLKIWAQREYKNDKGMLKNVPEEKERRNIIGQEGAALTSDTYVEVFTEWLDADGRPLPEGLGIGDGKDFGLTGRLARSAGSNTLVAAGSSDLDNFPIPPGRNIQVLKISDNLTTPEHFYVHVSGVAMAQKPEPDFGGSNAGEGLAGRPTYFTPFLTPVFDEKDTWQTWNAYRGIKRDRAEEENPDPEGEPAKPLPSYVWRYRPEYQFSQYELEVAEINRITETESGSEEKTNILNADTPVVASTDKLIEILYSLTNPTNDRISPIEGPQDLVFAFGEEEVRVTFGADKQIRFENIEHLASLTPEDFLSIRLYSNQDAGNILWEYAFEHVILIPNIADDVTVEIPADNNKFAISAVYLGYSSRSAEKQFPNAVSWEVDGSFGYFSPAGESAKEGVFSTILNTTQTSSDQTTRFYVRTSDGQKIAGPRFKVVPGVPHEIEVEAEGKATIAGRGSIDLTVKVRDKHSNKVADGTEVKIAMDSDLVVEGNGLTTDGEAKFVIKGYHSSGEKNLTITAGKAEYSHQVTIVPVNLAVNVPSHADVDSVVPVTVTADADGISLDGLAVELRTDNGKVKENILTLVSGSASTRLATGRAKGVGQVIVTLAGELAFAQYTTEPPQGFSIAESVLVADRPTDGTVTVDKGNGESFEQEYVVSTEITVKGSPGEIVPVEVGDLANPPIEPLVYYNMNHVYGDNVVGDAYGMVNAQWQSLTQSTESRKGFDGSYQFNESSSVTVPVHSAFQKTANIGVGFEAKFVQPGVIIDFSSAGQQLELLPDGTLRFTVNTASGAESLEIDNVALNSWHKIGAHLQDGKLQLQVDEQRVEKLLSGTAEAAGSSGGSIRIGGGFHGLLNQFRVIDWNAPVLASLPNGQTKMDVVIGASGEATVTLSSTGKMGQRTIASYDPKNPLGLPIKTAYADSSSGNGWWGNIKAGLTSSAVAFVDAHHYAAQTAIGFTRGLVLGDTSTPAGLIGDMVMGFIPFGDSRDVALQNYYKNYGNPEDYDEIILYLAYIGLGADVLMLIPATAAVGGPLNAAIAIIKPVVKLIRKLPMRGVLAKELENLGRMAHAAKQSGNWEPFVERAKMLLPFMQLFAAVAIDEKLRNLLANAVRNSVDFDNWLKYISDAPENLVVTGNEFSLIPQAYASPTSALRKLLQELAEHVEISVKVSPAEYGAAVAEVIGTLAKKIDGWDNIKHSAEAVKGLTTVYVIGGADLVKSLQKITDFGHRSIENVTKDLSKISLDVAKMTPEAANGLKRVLAELAIGGSKTKGAAHQIQAISIYQEQGVKIAKVEVLEEVVVNGTRMTHQRRYDMVLETGSVLQKVECKSWRFDKIETYTKGYLGVSGKYLDEAEDAAQKGVFKEEGAQLFSDLLTFGQNGPGSIKWVFDHTMTNAGKEIFKKTIMDALYKNQALRNKMMSVLGIRSDDSFDEWILKNIKLDDFIEVLPK